MFKMPKAFHVQAVEALPTQSDPTPAAPRNPRDLIPYLAMTRNLVTHVAVTGGVLYAGKKILDASTEIAVIAAKAKFH